MFRKWDSIKLVSFFLGGGGGERNCETADIYVYILPSLKIKHL